MRDDDVTELKTPKHIGKPMESPAFWTIRGNELFEMRKHEEALTANQITLKINPKCAVNLNNKVLSLKHLERYHEAIAVFNRALNIDSRDGRAQHHNGIVYAHMRNNCTAAMLLSEDMI